MNFCPAGTPLVAGTFQQIAVAKCILLVIAKFESVYKYSVIFSFVSLPSLIQFECIMGRERTRRVSSPLYIRERIK